MNRDHLEHVIRAAAEIVQDEVVVIGSQAILAEHPSSPRELLRSMEADVFPRHRGEPELADEIDGSLGEFAQFGRTFGYWAHGVSRETLIAPAGWEERLVRIEVPSPLPSRPAAIGWCLSAHDVVLSKLAAGRPHDLIFAEQALRAGLVDPEQLRLGVDLLPESVAWESRKDPRAEARAALDGILARLGA